MAAGALKTRGALGRIFHCKDEDSFLCPFCNCAPEDPVHLLVCCSIAVIAWRESPWSSPMDFIFFDGDGAANLIRAVLHADSVFHIHRRSLRAFALNAAVVMYSLWMARNLLIHEAVQVNIRNLISSIRRRFVEHADAWKVADRGAPLS